ncbi:NUDIX hydrolase [Pseudoneobacillus sp. C159]
MLSLLFNNLMGLRNLEDGKVIRQRNAVRAIIFRDDRILLLYSNKGDYKFPGGGVDQGETYKDALLREIAEETGFIHCAVKDKVGLVVESQFDVYDSSAYFQMISHYYLCELTNDEKIAQQLEGYELEQEFTPKWVTLEEAIVANETAMKQAGHNDWVKREIYVLNQLKKTNTLAL